MAPQNPRDMREYLRTLERGGSNNRTMAAVVGEAIKEVEREREADKVRRPAPPIELDAQTGYYDDLDLRRKRVRMTLDFPDVIFHTDGSKAEIKQYELWGREIVTVEGEEGEEEEARPWQLRATNTASDFRSEGYIPGARWTFRVRAIGVDAVQPGEWSDEITVQMVKDATPPPQPSAPVVESSRGQLIITWDGQAVSGPMPPDTSYAILAHGTASSPTKEFYRFGVDGGIAVFTGAEYMVPQFFRLMAVDEAGLKSPWSEQATGITKPLVDTDVIISELDAARTTIKNAGEILLDSQTTLTRRLADSDAALEGVRDYAEEQNEALNEALRDARDSISETDQKLTGPGGLTERISGAETKLADVGGLAIEAGKTLRQKLTEADTAISAVRTDTNTLKNTTVPKLRTDLTAATGRLTTAEGEIDTAQAEITSTKTELTAAKKQITDNKVITDAAAVRLGTAEGEITSAKTRLGTAETNINTLKNTTIPKLNTDLSSAAGRITSAEQSLQLIPGDIQSAKEAAIAAAYAEAEEQAAAAKTAAAADAKTKADKALADAKADATSKANAAQAAAIAAADIAARATAKAEAEAAEARAAATAAADAKTKADAAQAAALAAAKTYADAQANDAGELALEEARADATAKADAAQAAAIAAAAAETKAKTEAAEARAALDAKTKADKALSDAKADATSKADKALADAKTDATSKANAAQAAAIAAADTAAKATAKAEAEAAEARAAITAAADAKTKADAAQAAALAAAKTYAEAQANGASADALTAAKADATAKANAAKQAAIDAAALDATAKKEAAEANAAADAKRKADQALVDAKADAKTKADAALATALNSAARGDNVVINGSFEQDLTGWDPENTPDPTMFGIDSTVSRSGNKSFWTVGKGGFRQLGIPVTPGQTWELSCWYKTEGTYSSSNAGGLRIQARNATAWADGSTNALRSNADWTRATIRYVVPAGVTQIRARFAFNYTGGAKAWLDDFELVNITADLAAAADAQAKADAALATATAANVETNKQLAQLAANAGNMAPYGNLESFSGTYFPLNASTARSGERAFTHRITAGQVGYTMPDVPVTPGNWYQVSFWMKADRNISIQAGMPVMWVKNDGTVLNGNWGGGYTAAHRGPLSMDWKLVSFTVQAEAGVKVMRPRFYVWEAASGHADNGATLYMDDFILKDVTEYMRGLEATDRARLEALAAASRASDEARAAAGLANSMGRAWFQPEEPPAGYIYNWTSTRGTSWSEMRKDGVLLRRNLISNPRFINNLNGWSGSNGSWKFTAERVASVPAEHREFLGSDTAMRCSWVEGGTNGPYFANTFAEPLAEAMPVQFELKAVGLSGKPNLRLLIEVFNAAGARTGTQSGDIIEFLPGVEHHVKAKGTLPAGTARIVFTFYMLGNTGKDGDALLFSSALGEVGSSGEYFDGDTPDEREFDLWVDTDDGNTPKRWNGAGWSAVTDTKAIEAAKTAAAADATAKANAAKADAIAAAAGDATAKAEAARVLAEKNAAADATAKTEAAKTALTNALTADAAAKIATAKQEALTAAAADAASKANAAKAAAEQAAATHAAGLASGAQQAAIDAAATDAAAKAAAAQQAAIDAAATEAARVAGLAQTNAINAARNAAVELANAAKADAIDAAALDASFKADEAERRAKVDAAAAQARADTAVADAAAAAGIANGKGKVLVQNGAPAAADRNAQTLWIDTTGGANTPKRWTTGTTWVAVTDKVATDAAARAATAITDAANAAAAAGRAQTAADNAMSAAGSKSTIFYSTANPSGIASVNDTWRKIDAQKNVIGEWRYVGGSTPWQAQLITSEAISNLDVGKLTANTAVVNELVAQKIAAATASFQRVDAKNLFVTGTATLEEAVARRLAAETGTFITLTTDQLTAGSANLGEAVAQKIAAATATFQKVTVENITATATANLNSVVAQRIAAGTASFQTVKVENITATASANLNSVVAQRIAAGTASFQTVDAKNIFVTGNASLNEATARRFAAETGTFITLGVEQLDVSGNANFKSAVADKMFANMLTTNRITTQHMLVSNFDNLLPNGNFDHGQTGWGTANYWSLQTSGGRITPNFMRCMGITERVFGPTSAIDMEVNENDYYRISGWVRTNATTGSPRAELCWYWYTANRTFIGNNNFNIDTATADWTQHSHSVIAPPLAKYLRVRINAVLSHTAQYMDFDDLTVALATDASLVVNGSITAKHITASEELSAKVGQFLKLDVVDLVTTGTAKINEAVVTKLFTETFSTRKLYSNQVIIGQPNNVIPDPNFSDPEQMARINQHSTATVTLSADGDHAVKAPVDGTACWYRPLGVAQTPSGAKDWINVQPGEVWEWGLQVASFKGTGNWIQFVGRTIDGSAYKNPTPKTTLNPGSGTYKVRVTIPADCYWIMPEMQVSEGTQWVKKGSMYMKQIVDESLIVDGGILARHITASEALSAKVASFLELRASQVYVGAGANLVPDPTFRNPQKIMSMGNSGVGWTTYKSGSGTGSTAIQYAPRLANGVTPPDGYLYPLGITNASTANKEDWLPCSGGEKYEFAYRAYFGANTGPVQFRCFSNVLFEDGTTGSAGTQPWQTTGGNKSFEFVIPENAKSFGVTIQVKLPPENTAWWSIYGQNLSLIRKIDNALVVDGAITTRNLRVTEDMTVELLKAHKVEAGEINVNSLAADSAFIGSLRTHFLYANVFEGKSFTGGTFTGAVIRTTATANRGVRIDDTNGIRAWNSSGTQTFGVTAAGAVSATGSFTATANGISAALTTQTLGSFNRPMLAFRTPGQATGGYSPMIFAEGDSTGAGNYSEGSLVLMSSEDSANSTGRSELVLRAKGKGGYLGTQYGTNGETGIRWNDGKVFLLGLSPSGQYARQMIRHGKSAGSQINAGQTLDWTFTYGAPAVGHLLRPVVTVDAQPPPGMVLGTTVYSVYNSTFKCRVTALGSGSTIITTIFYMAVWGSDD